MKKIITFLFLITFYSSYSQLKLADPGFTSTRYSTSFNESESLVSMNADLLEWNGSTWFGAWDNSEISVTPPKPKVGTRAIFIGNGVEWTNGGEGFAIKLSSPLVKGKSYSLKLTYVSNGKGSDGSFNPTVLTGFKPEFNSAVQVGNLPAVGNVWTEKTFTFKATELHEGHTWLIIHTELGSSGIILAPGFEMGADGEDQ